MKKIKQLAYLFSLCGLLALSQSCNKCIEGARGLNCETLPNVQSKLDYGITPHELFREGVSLDSLYGKFYKEGSIFYLNIIDGTGLVAALENQDMNFAEWGCNGIDIEGLNNVDSYPFENGSEFARGARLRDGIDNTNRILNTCSSPEPFAAKLCRNIGDEWFLPSRGELNLMYKNLHKNGYGNFVIEHYWSSTESSADYAWRQFFNDDEPSYQALKTETCHVRAARAF